MITKENFSLFLFISRGVEVWSTLPSYYWSCRIVFATSDILHLPSRPANADSGLCNIFSQFTIYII